MFDQYPKDKRIMLFNGHDLNNWCQRDGQPATWNVEDNIMTVNKGDILSQETFTDALIHVEFNVPNMPDATGQAKGNSGVYVQGRYEIQVLDSYGINIPGKGDCGAIYDQFAPLTNACEPPAEWQSYDIIFRAARVNQEKDIVEKARITLFQNGIVIHNNIALHGPTGGPLDENEGEPGPLLLQDHGDKVQYRNIWLVHLPLSGSGSYEPKS